MTAKAALFEALYSGLSDYHFFNFRFEDNEVVSCGVASLKRDIGKISEKILKVLGNNNEVLLGTCLPRKRNEFENQFEIYRSSDVLLENIAEKLTEKGVEVKLLSEDIDFDYFYFK